MAEKRDRVLVADDEETVRKLHQQILGAVAREKKATSQLSFLSEASHRANQMSNENEICEYVCLKLKEIVGDGYIIVSR